jgi:hypothetical protein
VNLHRCGLQSSSRAQVAVASWHKRFSSGMSGAESVRWCLNSEDDWSRSNGPLWVIGEAWMALTPTATANQSFSLNEQRDGFRLARKQATGDRFEWFDGNRDRNRLLFIIFAVVHWRHLNNQLKAAEV